MTLLDIQAAARGARVRVASGRLTLAAMQHDEVAYQFALGDFLTAALPGDTDALIRCLAESVADLLPICAPDPAAQLQARLAADTALLEGN